MHLLFCANLINIFLFLGVLDLDIFPSEMLRVCLVCVICNSNSFIPLHSNFSIMIVHTLNMCTSLMCTFDYIFRIVELRLYSICTTFGMDALCNLLLQQFLFLFIQNFTYRFRHIENVHLLFFCRFDIYFLILFFMLNLDIFYAHNT